MSLVLLYVITFAVFLGLDYLGLTYLVKPTFERDIAHLLRDSPRLGPAFVFYAFYIVGLLWFVSVPGLQGDRSLLWVFATGALLGAMAYGTYEFTNLATLTGWSWRMVATDLIWGTVLTGLSASMGLWITRMVTST